MNSLRQAFSLIAIFGVTLVLDSPSQAQQVTSTFERAASSNNERRLTFFSAIPGSRDKSVQPTYDESRVPAEINPQVVFTCTDGNEEPFIDTIEDRPQSYANMEALILHLSSAAEQAVVLHAVTGQTLQTTAATNPDFATGARFTLGYVFNDVSTVEGTFFGLNHWSSSATINGVNNLRVPGDIALSTHDFFDSSRIQTSYRTDLYNAELNYLHALRIPGVSVLAGFRYLGFREGFNINSGDSDTERSDYHVQTQNDLYGGQFGIRVNRQWGAWGASLTGKGGVFGNVAQQRSHLADFNNSFVLRDSTTSGIDTSFVGDIGLNVTYQFNPTWTLLTGYNVVWINNIARAPNQLDFTDTPTSGTTLYHNSNVFLHGVNIGLAANW